MEDIMAKLQKSKLNLRLLSKLYPKMGKSILYQLVAQELNNAIKLLEEKEIESKK